MTTADVPIADADALACPLCGYDLRGLPEHRCPECGHAFDPDELRRARAERREWFFEHARRRLPLAFVGTAARSLWPPTFWLRLAAAHAIVSRQLVVWWLAWVALSLAVAAASVAAHVVRVHREWTTTSVPRSVITVTVRGGRPVRSFTAAPPLTGILVPPLPWRDAVERVVLDRQRRAPAVAVVAAVLWPTFAILAITLFGRTLRRVGIGRDHLRRCAYYAMPATLLPVYAVAIAVAATGWEPRWLPDAGDVLLHELSLTNATALSMALAVVASSFHLTIAYVRYLRLRHAVATVLLAQSAAWLAIAAALLGVGRL